MKKVILIIMVSLLLFGCSNIKKSSLNDIINMVVKDNRKIYNQYRTGYKYYLPNGLMVEDNKEYNEQFSSNKNNYYLFMDFISYHSKKKVDYVVKKDIYHSQTIQYKEKFGYLEIKELEDKLYIEMMYNYAKIEVVTSKEYLNEAIHKSISLLSSIKYNDATIDKILKDEILSYKEVPYNIFEPKEKTTNFLDYSEEKTQVEETKEIPDYDLVK